jgi:hypothetical protein
MLSGWASAAQTAERTSTWASWSEDELVLRVTDEQTLGDHGPMFFPDGRVEIQ